MKALVAFPDTIIPSSKPIITSSWDVLLLSYGKPSLIITLISILTIDLTIDLIMFSGVEKEVASGGVPNM